MDKPHSKNLNIILSVTVFVCGAAVMMVELIGSRLLAPYVGTSLIPWTTLIGVILASLSVGYWFGGRIADIRPSYIKLGFIILLAGISVAILLWLYLFLKDMAPLLASFNLGLAALFCSVFLFFIPSFLLGMITPYALRLALTDLALAGKTAGSLYAYSTVGSIVGTFAAGFIFIPLWGSVRTLSTIAILLVVLSLFFFKTWLSKLLALVVVLNAVFIWSHLAIFYSSSKVMSDQESFYNRLFVVKDIEAKTNRPIISVMSGTHLSQSARFADGSDDLVFPYTKFFRLVDYWLPTNQKVLMIGGGAYSVPRDYLQRNTKATIDVAEIDPLYTSIAQQYFSLQPDQRLKIYHQDARIFLDKKTNSYDAIFVDAFNGSGSVPFHLATTEAVKKMKASLNNQGLVIVNLIGSLDGVGSNFINSEYATYAAVFDQVKIFPLGNKSSDLQNVMLVAFKNIQWPNNLPNDSELAGFLTREDKQIKINSRILTDDWAPVDYFLASIF